MTHRRPPNTLAPPRVRARPAFTLIELIVVIALIAIILAIAVPVFSSFRTSARIENSKNLVQSVMTQARSLAKSYQRDVLVVAYWRGIDRNNDGTIAPSERLDDGQVMVVLMADADGQFFLPFQELYQPASSSNKPDPLFAGTQNLVSNPIPLPAGMALMVHNPLAADGGPAYLDFVTIRIAASGELSSLAPLDPSSPPTGNIRNWLNNAEWLLDEERINGEARANWNPSDRNRISTQRGLFLCVPPDNRPELKLTAAMVQLVDTSAMADAGVDMERWNETATKDNLLRFIEESGISGVFNPTSGRPTFYELEKD